DLNKLIWVYIVAALAIFAELHRRIASGTGFLAPVQIPYPLLLRNIVLLFIVNHRFQADSALLTGQRATIWPFAKLNGPFQVAVNRRVQPLNQFFVCHSRLLNVSSYKKMPRPFDNQK